MDFGSLLDYAKQNEKPSKEIKCYRTAFAPPKKVPKTKCLSENIQRFLARKEEEEKRKISAANKKREELLALRAQDSKSKKRVSAMLKSTKAANKAVIDDARDDVNTAVTMAGPSQPDEDDYGYVSQEASAFYNKLMDKYSSISNDEPKFSKKTVTVKDLSSTKDRVRMALLKEEEEEAMGHKRKRRKTKDEMHSKQDDDDNDNIQYGMPDRGVSEKESSVARSSREKPEPEVKKKKKPLAPPPMDFAELLKVAAQKQFEPIKIEKKEKEDEEDRPMTKKQREEYLREKEYRMRKEEKAAAAKSKEKISANRSQSVVQTNDSDSRANSAPKVPAIPRIPKLNGAKTNLESQNRMSGNIGEVQNKKSNLSQQVSSKEINISKQKPTEMTKQVNTKPSLSSREQELKTFDGKKSNIESNKVKDPYSERKPIPAQNVPLNKERRLHAEEKKLPTSQSSKPVIKEERRFSNSSSKPVIKEENSLVNNQALKHVVREDKKLVKPSSKPVIKEERRLPSSEMSKVPLKPNKPDTPQISKQSQSQQQCSSSSKLASDSVKNVDNKVSKNSPVNRIPPSKGSILKEQLTGMKGDPQKNHQPSNPLVKKDIKSSQTPVKSKVGPAPISTSGANPKEIPTKPTGNRPLTTAQSSSRDGFRNAQPERRKEIPSKGDVRRPTLMHGRGPPPGSRGLPPNRLKHMHPMEGRKRPAPKRRIESDDEYDSELDDFIDDGPEDSEDYSKYIKEIFGYDKSRYMGSRYVEEEDEDECMESNYAQQMKEEFVSTKIGIMEDLEDIKKEQMEKIRKKKTLSNKKRKI